ncbi:MAG: AMP-binding protein [Lachnospiraceae bacterium]|nr:AMP-binding protein [Lachnospiraceae bacterium]
MQEKEMTDISGYIGSKEYKKELKYWSELVKKYGKYSRFFNVKGGECGAVKVNADGQKIRAFLSGYGFSAFEFYASAFALYLMRTDRVGGCLINTVITGNETGEYKKTLLKTDTKKEDTFTDLLKSFRQGFSEAVNNTSVDIKHYLKSPVSYYSVYDMTALGRSFAKDSASMDAVALYVDGDQVSLSYNKDHFSDEFAAHMVANIESLIGNLINEPEISLTAVNILSADEKELLSTYCKGEEFPVDEDRVLSLAFREYAKTAPDDMAVNDGVNKVTYGELERSSNSVAADLMDRYGIGHGDIVGLMLPRTYHFLEMVLALNKIGAAFVAIDMGFPANRIGAMMKTAGAKYVITAGSVKEMPDVGADIICMEDLVFDRCVQVDILSGKNDLFTIVFTSGTTGVPKGVSYLNRQIKWICSVISRMFDYTHGGTIGYFLSFSFVASFSMYVALCCKGSVRILNEKEQKDPLLLVSALKKEHMVGIIMPPAVAVPIYESTDLNIDYILLAGAKLNELSKIERHTKLANGYGTTEIILAVSKIYNRNDIEDGRVSIGRPAVNASVYVLDAYDNIMPVGVPGEICVAGGGVADGYCNDPELTSEKFVENPFSDCESNRIMYRTGDIGFYNFKGEIEVVGRDDDQLEVRGFRIESGEITEVLKSFPEIKDIYIDVDKDNLVVYYTSDGDVDAEVYKDALRKELPYYMVPSMFVKMDTIPRNANGKIARADVKKSARSENIKVTDEVLLKVMDAYKEVLSLEFVAPDDDFLALGGNSVSAMKLILLLQDRMGVRLSAAEMLGLSTPVETANYIKENGAGHEEYEEKYSFEEGCPLSESQLNVYLDECAHFKGTAYNDPIKITFRGKKRCSVNALKEAIYSIIEEFPVLKGRIDNGDGPVMVFDAVPEITEGSLNDVASFVRPFETDKALSRFLVAEGSDCTVLCVDFHHLIFDGGSAGVLFKAIFDAVNGKRTDHVDKGILSYAAFEEMKNAEGMEEAGAFFDRMLADREEVMQLLPSIGEAGNSYEYIDDIRIDKESLDNFLRQHLITYNRFFASVFAYTLSGYCGSEKVLFNMITDGRGHIDLSGSVGMFVKTLPVLADCADRSTDDFLVYISDLIGDVARYDMYPFRLLAGKYDLNADIQFQYSQDIFTGAAKGFGEDVGIEEMEHDLNADLSFNICDDGDKGFKIRILFSSVYSEEFIRSFAGTYKLILDGIMKTDRLCDIVFTSEDDIRLMDEYNKTETQLPYADVLDAFNDGLKKYSGRLLVGYMDRKYTHAQGAYIANKVAEKVTELGIAGQDYISLFVSRSEWFLLASLGVLAMDGIYVPIDTTYPDERIVLMIRDTGSKAVLADDISVTRIREILAGNGIDIPVVNLSSIIAEGVGEADHLETAKVCGDDTACILYTSGTTGVPKGLKVTRRAMNNLTLWYVKTTGFTSEDIYGMHCSYVFDMHVQALYSPVVSGGGLYVLPEDIRLDLKKCNDYFNEHNCTHTYLTSQVGKLFAESGMKTTIKLICFGGMKLGMLNAPDSVGPFESYGPSENLAISTSIFANKRIDPSSIGRFVDNVKGYVLDKERRRLPIGAVGELYLTGAQLTSGYLDRDAENREAFFENPFDEKYHTIYASGDMVRFLPDGTLGIVGRRDGQVKIRGNRVELGEVESAVRSMDGIKEVTVQVVVSNGKNELAAYVVAEPGMEDMASAVKRHVAEKKPGYMVPAYVIKMDRIPLNINGKVDKKALPSIKEAMPEHEYVAPKSFLEERIAQAFEKVFGRENIGANDDFVSLGGDSLTAIMLLNEIGEYGITVADIFNGRTPAAIAAGARKVDFDPDIYSLSEGCPLTNMQLYMYNDIVRNNKQDSYLMPSLARITGRYTDEQIERALDVLFEHYPILRMHIEAREDGEIYLVPGENPPVLKDTKNPMKIISYMTKDFDIYKSLSKHVIIRFLGKNYVASLIHHMIFDLVSGNVFRRMLQKVLDGETIEHVDDVFLKVAAFNRYMSDTEEYKAADAYARSLYKNLDGVGFLEGAEKHGKNGYLIRQIEVDEKRVAEFTKNNGINKNILFTAAMACTLSKMTEKENVAFAYIENGRDRFKNFDAIGMNVNVMPLIAHTDMQDIGSMLKKLSEQYYKLMSCNYYPFGPVAQEYVAGRPIIGFQFLPDWIIADGGYDKHPLNETILNLILSTQKDFDTEALTEVVQTKEGYAFRAYYSGFYSRKIIKNMVQTYQEMLSFLLYGADQ